MRTGRVVERFVIFGVAALAVAALLATAGYFDLDTFQTALLFFLGGSFTVFGYAAWKG